MKNIVICISGKGSTMQAVLQSIHLNTINANVICVISNKENASGLQVAQDLKIPVHVIPNHKDQDELSNSLYKITAHLEIDYIVLAGFMRILNSVFVKKYEGKIINIHPSILPKFKGLHTHRNVIKAGEKFHGASTHFVNEKLDEGPLIMQCVIPVLPTDDEESLKKRLLPYEHKLYIKTLKLICNGNIYYEKKYTVCNKQTLKKPLLLDTDI